MLSSPSPKSRGFALRRQIPAAARSWCRPPRNLPIDASVHADELRHLSNELAGRIRRLRRQSAKRTRPGPPQPAAPSRAPTLRHQLHRLARPSDIRRPSSGRRGAHAAARPSTRPQASSDGAPAVGWSDPSRKPLEPRAQSATADRHRDGVDHCAENRGRGNTDRSLSSRTGQPDAPTRGR